MEAKLKRIFWILVTPIGLFAMAYWAMALLIWPSTENWLRENISAQSLKYLDTKIEVSKIKVQFFAPKIELQDIRIQPQSQKVQTIVSDLKIESISSHFDLFDLLSGRFQINALVITSPETKMDLQSILDDKQPNDKALPLDLILEALPKIPIRKVIVQDSKLNLVANNPELNLDLKAMNLNFGLKKQGIEFALALPSSPIQFNKTKMNLPEVLIEGALESQKLNFDRILIKDANLKVNAKAYIEDPKWLVQKPTGHLSASAEVALDKLSKELISKFGFKLPEIEGVIKSDFKLSMSGLDKFSGVGKVETQNVKLASFVIGNAFLDGKFDKEGIRFSEISLSHPAGEAKLEESSLKINKALQFQSLVTVKKLDLQLLLQSLGLKQIPVDLGITAKLPCKGTILPFELSCQGQAELNDFSVRSAFEKKSFEIAAIKSAKLAGQLNVNADQVSYQSDIQMGDSKGSSEGIIKYKEGFDIKYKASKLYLKDIANISSLKLEGLGSLEGATSGDSSAAIFNINLNTQNFFLDNYWLGQVASNMSYEKGFLKFDKIDGFMDRSRYTGSVDLDLNKSLISGKINSQDLEIQDVFKSIERIYKLPVNFEGKGRMNFVMNGPLDFWKMNYKLESQFQKGKIFTELYDSLKFNISAVDGKINADQITMKKNQSSTFITGSILPGPQFDLHLKSQNYRLEESNLINMISSRIFGMVQAQADLSGTSSLPIFALKLNVTDTVLEDQEISNSHLELNANKDRIFGNSNIFGSKIQSDYSFPFSGSNLPMHIRAKTTDFNFANLLAILGGSNVGNEYESSLTADVDIVSPQQGLRYANGAVEFKELQLKRGQLSLQNPVPMKIKFTNGFIDLQDFRMIGPNTNIQFNGDHFTLNDMQLNINAKTELRLFQVFLPFLDDLGGPVDVSAGISGSYLKPQIIGSGKLSNATIKIKGFPHAIERLNVESVFSHSKISIPSIKGSLASGQLSGDGSILINGVNDIPTNIKLHLDGVTMNVPEKVKSSGSADLNITGRWFPFLLAGQYNISSALVEKEFQDESGAASSVSSRKNVFLPKVLKQNEFEPILFDLNVKMDKNALVKNSLMDGAVSGQLNVKGAPQTPSLLGKISIEPGSKLIFKDKIFDVISGQANFTDPNEINPELFVSAGSRVTDFDVTLLVQGPAKNPNIKLSSMPPLPEQDIISLLALGITSSKLDQNVQSKDQAAQTGYEIGAAILSKNLTKQFKNTLGVNLQFGSRFDSTKNINVPKVTLSKKLNKKLEAALSVTSGAVNNKEVRLQYSIDQNFSAIGSWEGRDASEGSSLTSPNKDSQSIFGLDLEFKREFK